MDNKQLIVQNEADDDQLICVADDRKLDISKKFKLAKFITIGILAVFAIGMLVIKKQDVNIDNMQFFWKYLSSDSAVFSYDGSYKTIDYNVYTNCDFEIFKEDFVVATTSNIGIYSTNGSEVLKSEEFFANPKILTNTNRMIVFDQAGNTYSIYNSLKKIYTDSLDYEINGGDLSESGVYALITRTGEYKGAVYMYRGDGELLSRVLKNRYIVSVSLSEDGEKCYIASVYNNNETGLFSTEIMVCNPFTGKMISSMQIEGTMVLSISAYEGGAFVVCDNGIHFVRDDGSEKSVYNYVENRPFRAYFTNEYAFLCFSEKLDDSQYSLRVFNADGNIATEKKFPGKPIALGYQDGYIYIMNQDILMKYKFDENNYSQYDYEGNCTTFRLTKNNIIYFCYPGYAKVYDATQIIH